MFPFARCSAPGCESTAFAGSATCLMHHPAPAAAREKATARLLDPSGAEDICVNGIELSGLDLSRRRFVGCSFIGSRFEGTLFTGSSFVLCFFDGSVIDSCDFSSSDAQFCSFGSVEISNSSFEGSELIHCNFDGSRIRESTFNGSNLYDSRFIRCELEGSDFIDCDLKRVYLIPAKQANVSFKGSNTAEAIRDLEHLYI